MGNCGTPVKWQLTGGEPLVDKLFPDVYSLAFELGMTLSRGSGNSPAPPATG
jgi:hypothetical protein